ncbi:MAG: Na/Pi cotransporter family protein [Pseudomonadota bacterium]
MPYKYILGIDNKSTKWTIAFLASLAAAFVAYPLLAETGAESNIDWSVMGMRLFGGLALFLFGMEQMVDALKAVAGKHIKLILAKLTSNRFMGVAMGAFVTGLIQSSSVTTVLVVGFITAGLMSMSQSVGVIMGANIGTTITAQIIAFQVTDAALLMIGVGLSMLFASKNEHFKQYGAILMGLGMVFFGMSVMGDAMQPLRSYQPFLDLMIQMENPLIGILVAAGFTGLIQSSSAPTAFIIVMASQGFLSLPAGIALVLGANIGTCITAILASMGKTREAMRAAVVHVIFNVAGVLVWVLLIDQLANFVTLFSPSHPELTGVDRLCAETPRQIANAHTFFNIANTLLFIGFTTQIARLVEWLIPDSTLEEAELMVSAKYLDEELLSTTSLALDRVRLEVSHMGEIVQEMLDGVMPAILNGNKESLESLRDLDDKVDILYEQIIDYMGRISQRSLTDDQTEEFLNLMEAVSNLENIGDTIETNLVDLGFNRINADFSISEPTRVVLIGFHQVIAKAFRSSVLAVAQNNKDAANNVISMKDEIAKMANSAEAHEAARLVAEEPNRIPAYTIEVDIIEKQKRIYYFAKRMAKTVVAVEAEEA